MVLSLKLFYHGLLTNSFLFSLLLLNLFYYLLTFLNLKLAPHLVLAAKGGQAALLLHLLQQGHFW